MLRSFHIQNFKSLTDFKLDGLGQFGCLIGLNGAGKTTVLQALDFMAHLAAGTIDDWLKEREWKRSDLTSKFLKKQLITFRLTFDIGEILIWEGAYNVSLGHCTREEVRIENSENALLHFAERKLILSLKDGDTHEVNFSSFAFSGSVLSFLRSDSDTIDRVSKIISFMRDIKSLELLAPHRMRMKSRPSEDVGSGGEKLSGYMHKLSSGQKRLLVSELRKFYPHIFNFHTKAPRAGWTQISANEIYDLEGQASLNMLVTEAKHLNDGLLRILTIVAQTKTDHQFLLFDEIENGINPEKIGQLVKYMLEAKQQIMVTTHNPLILNFLPEEKARESVFFLYRNRYGATKATQFYEIPEVAEKLEVLGPGEAFLDTSLEELVKRIEAREEVKA